MLTKAQRQQFQEAQTDLDNLTVERLRDLFALLDIARMEQFRDGVFDTMPGLIEELSDVSALLAASEYELAREQSEARGRFVVNLADPAPAVQIGKATSFALAPMFWPNYIERGRVELQQVVEQRVEAMAPRLVRQGGRETLVQNTERDPARPRYRRRLSSETANCDFCKMLSSRNAVYLSEDSAGAGQHWHDNCVVPGTMVSGPDSHVGYRRHYEGEIITLVTAAGNQLTITPKHPVLTDRGWVSAGLLNVGDKLISAVRRDRNVVHGPDVDHVPTGIENVVRALSVMRSAARLRMPGTAEQFHGDGFASEVHVVTSNHLLRNKVDAALRQPLPELDLHGAPVPCSFGRPGCAGPGELQLLARTPHSPARGVMGRFQVGGSLARGHGSRPDRLGLAGIADGQRLVFQPAGYHASRDVVMLGHRKNALPISVSTGKVAGRGNATGTGVGVLRKFDPPTNYEAPDGAGVFAQLGADLLERLAGAVQVDNLVDKRSGIYHGDVLNLETSEGWYSANSVTVSNCNCYVELQF